MKDEVIVLGFGGNAVDFFDTIASNYTIIGFVDDDEKKHHLSYKGIRVYPRTFLQHHPTSKVISLIGSEKTIHFRNKIIEDFKIAPDRFGTAIHPKAIVSADAVIGKDVVIMPGVVITSNAVIGNHIFILANSVIHHDVSIGNYTLIGSNVTIAGNVSIGEKCYIGSCSSFKNDLQVGSESIIGMSANVLKSVPPNSKMIGNPAKSI